MDNQYPVTVDAVTGQLVYSQSVGFETPLSGVSSQGMPGVLIPGVSTELGALNYANVSADIPATTIFTPTVTGMYLYSFYGTTTVNGSGTAPNVYLRWTDEGGPQAYFQYAGNLDHIHNDGANQISVPIWAIAGTPITFSALQGDYTTTRWAFHVTVTTL